MNGTRDRRKVHFRSAGERCAAWHYPGTNGGAVVMAGGFAVPKEPATDLFAQRFSDAGFAVLAFDYRRLGESEGRPRLVMRPRDMVADWEAAIQFARTLEDVDPARVAVWSFSASAGHVFSVAARNHELGAAIAQTPLADAPVAMVALMRYSTPLAQLRLMTRGARDLVGGMLGREPLLVPLTGRPGEVAMLSTPDALRGGEALQASRHPDWLQKVAARSVLALGAYRPGRHAPRIRCPLLVVICEQDKSSPAGPAIRAAERAPRGELARLAGDHYAPFMEAHDEAVEIQVQFLQHHLLDDAPALRPATLAG